MVVVCILDWDHIFDFEFSVHETTVPPRIRADESYCDDLWESR